MIQALRQRWGAPGLRRGFTLVELMIAMALVGMITLLIYGLFVRTSDALTDVEGMSTALEQARFGIDHVRVDLQSAGSQMSPNPVADPWFQPNDGNITAHAVMGYDDWQDEDLYTGDIAQLGVDNPQSQFSGVVLLGAYDVPASFMVSFPGADMGVAFDHDDVMVIESTESGMRRLMGYDPFDVAVHDGVDVPTALHSTMQDRAEESLLRVTDLNGYSQVTPITEARLFDRVGGAIGGGAGMPVGADGWEMDLTLQNLHFAEGDEPAGFDRWVEDDVRFDAALIDAYWYHVRPAIDDATNFQLVRQRLDAGDLVNDVSNLNRTTLNGLAVGPPMVISDYVVDFRVWFDCIPMSGNDWQETWNPDTGDCIGENPASSNPEFARFAHARLSTRTPRENSNRPHFTVVDDWEGFEVEDGLMRTYNVTAAGGSAGVVTVQTGAELTNFSMRNIN